VQVQDLAPVPGLAWERTWGQHCVSATGAEVGNNGDVLGSIERSSWRAAFSRSSPWVLRFIERFRLALIAGGEDSKKALIKSAARGRELHHSAADKSVIS
jgi:hypothetical protein